jgi:hypothetical protein
VIVNPGTVASAVPAGLVDGINYNTADAQPRATVVPMRHLKILYTAGSFNNWQPRDSYAMKKILFLENFGWN